MDRIRSPQRVSQIEHLLPVYEYPDVRPDPVLLVDHPKAESGIPPVEFQKHFGQGFTTCFDFACTRIGAQRGWNEDLHRQQQLLIKTLFPRRRSPGGGARYCANFLPHRGSSIDLRWWFRNRVPQDRTNRPSWPDASP